jgi:hypothetical protein
MGGQDWDPSQSALSEVARAAMITNLLTEDQHGIHDLRRHHEQVGLPVLKQWRVFEEQRDRLLTREAVRSMAMA